MNKYKHLTEKAVRLREKGYSLNDICLRLNKSKTTVYYWIKNVNLIKDESFLKRTSKKIKLSRVSIGEKIRERSQKKHNGFENFAIKLWNDKLKDDFEFKQFIMCYSCEGDRKSRWLVGLCNSDPYLIEYGYYWLCNINFRNKKFGYLIQTHIDQNEKEVKNYWSNLLGINENEIKTIRKSNSGKMSGRNWNSKYGVLTIRFCDAYLKTMIITWMNLFKSDICKKHEWGFKSILCDAGSNPVT